MEIMQTCPDQYYDLAIVDPPYGINLGKMAFLSETNTTVKQKNGNRLNPNKREKYTLKDWDNQTPDQSYFDELKRISKDQIIFGIDYFDWTGVGKGRIKWDKCVPEGVSFSRYETAYCSLIDTEIEFKLLYSGMCQAKSLKEPTTQQGNKKLNEKRIHPCQKPLLLYNWLLLNFAKEGYKIIDTHGGSMNIAIAADNFRCDLAVCEIDREYFQNGTNKYHNYKRQLKIF